jgi:hypothetical protein
MEEFFRNLAECSNESELEDFCRRRSLHGTPEVFRDREDDFYCFRKRIATNFSISFHEVYITGSAKLGFSPFKKKIFDLESDIDVALVSSELYNYIMDSIHGYQMDLRQNRKAVSAGEIEKYHRFLEYSAMGWMRPDLLPTSFQIEPLRKKWFEFFGSVSHGNSEVGNYKVTAGAFRSYYHLERYTLSGLKSLKMRLQVGKIDATSDKA